MINTEKATRRVREVEQEVDSRLVSDKESLDDYFRVTLPQGDDPALRSAVEIAAAARHEDVERLQTKALALLKQYKAQINSIEVLLMTILAAEEGRPR